MNKYGALLLALLAFTGCHRGRKITGTNPAPLNPEAHLTLNKVVRIADSVAPSYTWVRANGSVLVDNGRDNIPEAGLSLRMRRDSVIWARVSVLIEMGKALLTKDSAVILNSINRSYTVSKVADLQAMLAIQGLDLPAVQRLLIGIPPFNVRPESRLRQDSSLRIETQTQTYKEVVTLDPGRMRMSRYKYERNMNQKIEAIYSDFKEVEGRYMPHKIEFYIQAPDYYSLILTIQDYTFPIQDEAPFRIPASYKREN